MKATRLDQALRLGVITGPDWADPTGDDFTRRHPQRVTVLTHELPMKGFDWSLAQMALCEVPVRAAAQALVAQGCDVVVQAGPAFAYQMGVDAAGAQRLQDAISRELGCPVVLNGAAVLRELGALAHRRIAVACPYYDQHWQTWITQYLEQGGYEVAKFTTFCNTGLFPNQATVNQRKYRFSPEEVMACVRAAANGVSGLSGVLIGGSGVRTLDWIDELSGELGLPLVSADASLYHATLARLYTRDVQCDPYRV